MLSIYLQGVHVGTYVLIGCDATEIAVCDVGEMQLFYVYGDVMV
jgi:hypothetical protein